MNNLMEKPQNAAKPGSGSKWTPQTSQSLLRIQEKHMKALIATAEGLIVTFQRLADSTEGKNHYALVVTAIEHADSMQFVLCTTHANAIRRFSNLDCCRRFIQKLSPDLARFYTVIYPTLEDHCYGGNTA